MKTEGIEKIYAGGLAKIIGIRLGAPVEGWTYEKIKSVYGALSGYPVAYKRFAADDDSNGPLFFLRALEDSGRCGAALEADDVAEALLNYAPFEHGFFWWGGYGWSTEHTAYLNLRAGIPAPRSGSIEQNGSAVAEQIGGQIFIDTWGLAAPGNPDLAARMAARAASVTHDGEGINGGVFIAACISAAFEEQDIHAIIEKGLSYIPSESSYARLVREIMTFHESHPKDWEACFAYIQAKHGYDKYPGNCHILPNTAVILLSLLYGGGDFSDTLNICNRCGWDTDCNVGNVATIMGVRGGLSAIKEEWRQPINDFLACSSVVGSLNLQDIPYGACYIAKMAWRIVGEPLPEPFRTIIDNRIDSCHFEFPGSTHAMEIRVDYMDHHSNEIKETLLHNTDETAHTGLRSLRASAKPVNSGERVCVYKHTYLFPSDFHDSRYDPAFSPLVYPGQTIHGSVMLPPEAPLCSVHLYARNARTGVMYMGEAQSPEKGEWAELEYAVPLMDGVLLDEIGFAFEIGSLPYAVPEFSAFVDDLYTDGMPAYTVDFSCEKTEIWTDIHREVSQFTRLKGLLYLDGGKAHLSCADMGEAYTGHYSWKDYKAGFCIEPVCGENHYVCLRVQGGVRGYFVGFESSKKFVILKNTRRGLQRLSEAPFDWQKGTEYTIEVIAEGSRITARVKDVTLIVVDKERPYLEGFIGLAVRDGSHLCSTRIEVCPIKTRGE
ncbi:MAG: ADP-ribosylglycohydrolase family protein [Oscillospiraceae bacterium]|nr:ADP-ribosylglycohydrolase family protein [Oscillospiraceae bacterium]